MEFSIMPDWSAELRNLYWHLRYIRDHDEAARRRYYRRISDEKKRLFLNGVDKEEIRLLCRHLSNPRNKHAEIRYCVYAEGEVCI